MYASPSQRLRSTWRQRGLQKGSDADGRISSVILRPQIGHLGFGIVAKAGPMARL